MPGISMLQHDQSAVNLLTILFVALKVDLRVTKTYDGLELADQFSVATTCSINFGLYGVHVPLG
jgi:hypothetical protein